MIEVVCCLLFGISGGLFVFLSFVYSTFIIDICSNGSDCIYRYTVNGNFSLVAVV